MPYRNHSRRYARPVRLCSFHQERPRTAFFRYSEGARLLTGLFTLTGTLSLAALALMIYNDLA